MPQKQDESSEIVKKLIEESNKRIARECWLKAYQETGRRVFLARALKLAHV